MHFDKSPWTLIIGGRKSHVCARLCIICSIEVGAGEDMRRPSKEWLARRIMYISADEYKRMRARERRKSRIKISARDAVYGYDRWRERERERERDFISEKKVACVWSLSFFAVPDRARAGLYMVQWRQREKSRMYICMKRECNVSAMFIWLMMRRVLCAE